LALGGDDGGGDSRGHRIPAHGLAMRGVAEIETFLRVLAAKTQRVGAHGDGHGFYGLALLEIAALGGEDGLDVLFDGHGDRDHELAIDRADAQWKIGREWRGIDASGRLELVVSGDVEIRRRLRGAALRAFERHSGICGGDGEAGAGFIGTR
jgi:hypothetical protein